MKSIFLVFLISLISLLALSYKLENIPNGIYVDEAVSGFNAYSILKTGKDEYGKEFPIAFRFFGSYSPPLYVYLTTIPVFIFGLNEYSVRIISVICASLFIFILFGFLKNMEIDKKIIPLLLLLFIITPWNFFYARTGYELYLGFFLFSLGVFLLWKSLTKKIWLPAGLIILSVSTYASHPQIYSAPMFILGFLILFIKQIDRKYLLYGLVVSLAIQMPHLSLLSTNAFLNKSDLFYLNEILLASEKIPLPQFISIPLSFLFSFLARIISYFSLNSLFFFPDPDPQRSMPEISVFYNWMVVPFLIGIFAVFLKIHKSAKFLILLVSSTIIPASLTRDPFSTQRALGLLLPFFLIICIGISKIYTKIGFKKFIAVYLAIFCVSIIVLWRSYFVLLPAERAKDWSYGYKTLAQFISKNHDSKFVIDQSRLKPAYIEIAFFNKTDPSVLQESTDRKIRKDYYNDNEFNPNYNFENIDIRAINWKEDIYKDQILVGDELAISPKQITEHFLTEIFLLTDPRGYPIFKAYKTNPQKKCAETKSASSFCKNSN